MACFNEKKLISIVLLFEFTEIGFIFFINSHLFLLEVFIQPTILLIYLLVFLFQMLDFIIEPGNDTLVLIIFLLMCDLHLIDSILQFLFGIMNLSILLAADVEQFIIFLLDNSFQVESQPLCLLLEPLLLTFRILGHDLALVRFIICDLLQLADLSFNLLFILLAADLQIGDFFLFLVAFNEQFAIRITHKKDHPFQSSYFLLQKLQVVKILQLSVGSRGE